MIASRARRARPHVRAEHGFSFEHIPRWVADREPVLRGVESETDLSAIPSSACRRSFDREDTVGNDSLILMFRLPKGRSHEQEVRCIERFGKEVIAEYRRLRG